MKLSVKKMSILLFLLSMILSIYSFINDQYVIFIITLIVFIFLITYIVFKFLRKFNGIVIINRSLRKRKIYEHKKVTAVIPNYNYAKYLEDRLLSIINQTYLVDEIIIMDDASDDNSDEIIKELIKKYNMYNIRYVRNKENSGSVFRQWEKAFFESSNDYLWICEADDLCSKYFLNVAMQGFDHDNVVISYTESLGIDEKGKIFKKNFRDWISYDKSKLWNKSFVISGEEFVNKSLCSNCSIINVSSVVFKKKNMNDIKRFIRMSQDYKLSGDWIFYANYLQNGYISYFTDSLNYHRMHDSSVTNNTDESLKYIEMDKVQRYIQDIFLIKEENKLRVKKVLNIVKNNIKE